MAKLSLSQARLGLLLLGCLGAGLLQWARDPVRLRGGEHRGIDVSAHQGRIDWPTVAAAGIEFAYIKASEGGDWVDEHFQANWEGAGAAGIRRGAYHFFTLRRPGADQAENFLKVAPPDLQSLPPVIDLEFGGNTSVRPPRAIILRELGVFLERVEAAHRRPAILYLLPEFEKAYRVKQRFPREIWLRSLMIRPPAELQWTIWQYTPMGRVPGIQGDVDLNVAGYSRSSQITKRSRR
ncbi:MAG: lysozyme [Candidatus Eremiobacteraeota bacterium]|nr:lysozyme [Candidatus Eremiobacteraeota bacterium]MCW5871803.1 lysozyme [Candidatus Eremiobacteraeota bacterium]